MSIITEFRVCPDHRARAVELLKQIIVALAEKPPYTEDQRVMWDGLERIVQRFIGATEAIAHPIGVHSPDFWTTWRRFVERNGHISRLSRWVCLDACPQPDTSPEQTASLPVALQACPAEQIDGPLKLSSTIGTAMDLRRRPILDNATTITSFITTWGEDDAPLRYEDGSLGLLTGERGNTEMKLPTWQTTTAHQHIDGRPHRDPEDRVSSRQADPSDPEVQVGENAITLSEAIKQRLDSLAKKLGDRRGDESHGRVLRFALDFLGNVRLDSIAVEHLRKLELALSEIPARKGIPRSACVSLHSRYLYAQENGWNNLERIGQTTLRNTYYGCLNGFVAWAREKTSWKAPSFSFDQESCEAPPAEDRDAFTNEELIRFFSLPLFTGCLSATHFWKPGQCFVQNDLYWGYLIHFFMGLRPAEIGQLLVDDIVESDGMSWIDLRDEASGSKSAKRLKSKAARRRIPVLGLPRFGGHR